MGSCFVRNFTSSWWFSSLIYIQLPRRTTICHSTIYPIPVSRHSSAFWFHVSWALHMIVKNFLTGRRLISVRHVSHYTVNDKNPFWIWNGALFIQQSTELLFVLLLTSIRVLKSMQKSCLTILYHFIIRSLSSLVKHLLLRLPLASTISFDCVVSLFFFVFDSCQCDIMSLEFQSITFLLYTLCYVSM